MLSPRDWGVVRFVVVHPSHNDSPVLIFEAVFGGGADHRHAGLLQSQQLLFGGPVPKSDVEIDAELLVGGRVLGIL